jgi:hypothetical protein
MNELDVLVGVLLNFDGEKSVSKSGKMIVDLIRAQENCSLEDFWNTPDVNHNETLVSICESIGHEFSSHTFNPIRVIYIPKKYLDHYNIVSSVNNNDDDEYSDGTTSIVIDYESYVKAEMVCIIKSHETDAHKLVKLMELASEPKYTL